VKRFLPLLPLLVLLACATQTPAMTLPEAIQTLTATQWTPTVTATPVPNTARLVELLNRQLVGTDPLAETVDAKFYVIDIQFIPDDRKILATLRIDVECECVYSRCCANERTFVQLIRALAANGKTAEKVQSGMPSTVHTLQVAAFEQMQPMGMIQVAWSDVLQYAGGQINGNQLGSRIVRLAP
jgi:hypothetical protein